MYHNLRIQSKTGMTQTIVLFGPMKYNALWVYNFLLRAVQFWYKVLVIHYIPLGIAQKIVVIVDPPDISDNHDPLGHWILANTLPKLLILLVFQTLFLVYPFVIDPETVE